jgi:beta-aspartyl-peptidase (threonine type)
MSNKKYGRVGDSPVIGAGTYADNKTAAISCTGNGEEFIRFVVASEVAAQIRYTKCTAAEAVAEMLNNRLQPDDGGIIAVCPNGEITMQFSTKGMARAAADSSGRFEVLWDEDSRPSGQPAKQ